MGSLFKNKEYTETDNRIVELWDSLYSNDTVGKMMSGHAYSTALRAHFLTFIILHEKLPEHPLLQLNKETKSIIKDSFHELLATNKKSIEDLQGNIGIK
ncbi:hypothetical protein AVEN_48299-1 [Araneus ventricosus]|uniref:Uncharacterized protein n=1 Tax=Araneus ventricosus TaxID=182803 RepID=A0A4Y2J8A1_ARAVE|nr:hypothetical protein AVEN_48299-1 [Araneus ventricosus]